VGTGKVAMPTRAPGRTWSCQRLSAAAGSGHEEEDQRAHDAVVRRVGRPRVGGVPDRDPRVADAGAREVLLEQPHHRGRDVECVDPAVRTEGLGERDGRGPAPGPELEEALAWLRPEQVDEHPGDRLEPRNA